MEWWSHCLQETALCCAGCHEACTELLPENLGGGFSAEGEVIDQVETSRGSGEEGGRREDVSIQRTAQVMKRDNIVFCFSKPSLHANSNSSRHFLPCSPQQQHIYGLNIFKSSVFFFLYAFKYSSQWASLLYFKLHKADCLPLWFQTYLKHLNK